MPELSTAVAVNVRVVYLARLREAFGSVGEALVVPGAAPEVSVVLDLLRARGTPWLDELAPRRAVRVAVNHELAPPSTVLRDGDEVALLPPVTGG